MARSKKPPAVDVRVTDNGTTVSFKLETEKARTCVDGNVKVESFQFLGPSLVVDHRYAETLLQGMAFAGLELA